MLTCSLCEGVTPTEDGPSVVCGEILGIQTWPRPADVRAAPQRPERASRHRNTLTPGVLTLTTPHPHEAQQTLSQPYRKR